MASALTRGRPSLLSRFAGGLLPGLLCLSLAAPGCSRGGQGDGQGVGDGRDGGDEPPAPGADLGGAPADLTGAAADGAATDGAAPAATCRADADCGADLCVVGRCYGYSDLQVPITIIRSSDAGLVAGVDRPGPLRVFAQIREQPENRDYLYQATLDPAGTMWSGGRYAGPVSNGYIGMQPVRDPAGKIVCAHIAGGMVTVPEGGGVDGRSVLAFAASYSPKGALHLLARTQVMGSPSDKYPVRLWTRPAMTWQSDLVFANAASDEADALRYRADGTPEVLATSYNTLRLARRGLDSWNAAPLYTWPGTHFAGLRVLNLPDGSSHVFIGTYTYMREPSTGELILDYLRLAPDGSVARQERIPVGGYAFTWMDAAEDGQGNAYALIRGPLSGDRYPSHLVKVSAMDVKSTVIANFERTTSARALAAASDGTIYLVAGTGYNKPVLVRALRPR